MINKQCLSNMRLAIKIRLKHSREKIFDALLLDHWLFSTKLPDFMIIGVQKAGTTTAHQMLSQHPGLRGSQIKELHYFDTHPSQWSSFSQYQKNFRKWFFDRSLTFESTTGYVFAEEVPAELARLKPDLKIIVILREPVSRAYSAWNMYRSTFENTKDREIVIRYKRPFFRFLQQEYGVEERVLLSFDDFIEKALDPEANQDLASVIHRGIYHLQLERYLQHFPRNQILILEFQEFTTSMEQSLHQMTDFLGVPRYHRYAFKKANSRDYPHRISEKSLSKLKTFYQPHNQKLYDLLGRRFEWWD